MGRRKNEAKPAEPKKQEKEKGEVVEAKPAEMEKSSSLKSDYENHPKFAKFKREEG